MPKQRIPKGHSRIFGYLPDAQHGALKVLAYVRQVSIVDLFSQAVQEYLTQHAEEISTEMHTFAEKVKQS